MPDICKGCDGPPAIDHFHQWINPWGAAISCMCIDGNVFLDSRDAANYIIKTLECTGSEALTFLRTLPKIYN